jgi:tetratricopeptide (TPR) repeat protein
VGHEALLLNSREALIYGNLATAYMHMNRPEEARAVCEKAIAAKLDTADSGIHATLYEIAFAENDTAGMQRELRWRNDKDWKASMLPVRIEAALASGRLHEARSLLREAQNGAREAGAPASAAGSTTEEAMAEAEFGNKREARDQIAAALAAAHGVDTESDAALVLARAGDEGRAQVLINDVAKRFPEDTRAIKLMLPAAKAALVLNRDPDRVLEVLRMALDQTAPVAPYYRGLAYLSKRSGKEAAAEFRKIVDMPNLDPPNAYCQLARLGLARAQALIGEIGESRRHYETFLAVWQSADPDLQVLQQARAEYAALR